MSGPAIGTVVRPPMDRFIEKVELAESGCLEWVGGRTTAGYGQFYVGRRESPRNGKCMAHRWSYEQFVGPIPEGFQLDHLCRNPACVNPDHLEPVTPGENYRRGNGIGGTNARKTHCNHGHPLEGGNLYTNPNKNERRCRTCSRLNSRLRYERFRTVAS